MASKKYLFLAGLFSLLVSTSAFAQDSSSGNSSYMGQGYDYMDSSYIPASGQAQQTSFMNNQSAFPAKPRDMWELGVNGGYYSLISDVSNGPGFNWAAGLSLRKSLGYTFSLRLSGNYGKTRGQDYQLSHQLGNLPASVRGDYPNGYVANYESTDIFASLDLIASLNNILFHKAKNKVDWYLLGGYSLFFYQTNMDLLNGSTPYNYSASSLSGDKKDIKKNLKDMQDGNYETAAIYKDHKGHSGADGKYNWDHALDAGMGVEFKLSKRVSLALEQKFILPFDDYIDGKFIQNAGATTSSPDIASYTSIGFNFNLGNASKRVQPLWWMNPLDYAYNELNAPRHMKLPKPVLDDSDGDGVTDQFDLEPNTPKGAAVDTHGRALDTDGDGVPDYKDQQLITPTYCQPVDENGVGKCPDPECCKNVKAACNLGYLPSISFKGRSVTVGKDQQAMLDNVANQMRQSPDCKVVVTGHAEASKSSEQLSWDRVNSVIEYLSEKQGISRDRFIFQYSGVPGDTHTVDLRSATDADAGPNMVPPPHPNLRRSH